jgi:hypothetical protein
MAAALIGTIHLSPAAADIVHRMVILNVAGTVTTKDMIADPTFACHDGDFIQAHCVDVNVQGLSSPPSDDLSTTASVPELAPSKPVVLGFSFALAP